MIPSLIVSILALLFMNLAVQDRKTGLGLVVCISLFVACYPTGSFAVFLHGLFTLPVFLVILIPKYGRTVFIPASIIAMLLAYGYLYNTAVVQDQRYEHLREQFPAISLEERLPLPPKPNSRSGISTTSSNLDIIEYNVEATNFEMTWVLKKLHDERVQSFVTAPGFGNFRMPRPSEAFLTERDPPKPILQPHKPDPIDLPTGEILSSGALDESLSRLHLSGILDFVNPEGFGYVKSRTQVAGFRPHRFSKVPQSRTGWIANSVELVGILVHEQPAVYVSEYLPRMDELKKTKTRPLDTFEKEGLAEIEKGEELFVRGNGDAARMMGAIRNAKQCVECHGGNRGDLLGAFSYRLKKQ